MQAFLHGCRMLGLPFKLRSDFAEKPAMVRFEPVSHEHYSLLLIFYCDFYFRKGKKEKKMKERKEEKEEEEERKEEEEREREESKDDDKSKLKFCAVAFLTP